MEKVTPAVQKFFENFKSTHYVQRVIKSVALISHIEEIGGIRFYLYPPSHGENHAILSLYKNEKSRDWELALLHDAETVYWADDMFFFNKRDRLAFCKELSESGLDVHWIAQLRADNIDLELAEAMRAAGCVKVCLGTEAGSDVLLRSIDKDITVEKIRNGVKTAVAAGLKVKTWWIVGLPGSSNLNDHLSAIDLIEDTRPHEVAVHNFIPLPGTQYWTDAERFGIHLPGPEVLEDIYYYGLSDALRFDYISKEQIQSVLAEYDVRLTAMGYLPTDRAPVDAKYVYTTPLQKTTFRV